MEIKCSRQSNLGKKGKKAGAQRRQATFHERRVGRRVRLSKSTPSDVHPTSRKLLNVPYCWQIPPPSGTKCMSLWEAFSFKPPYTCVLISTHIYSHTQSHTHTPSCIFIQTTTYMCIHKHPYVLSYTATHSCPHAYARTFSQRLMHSQLSHIHLKLGSHLSCSLVLIPALFWSWWWLFWEMPSPHIPGTVSRELASQLCLSAPISAG